MDGTICQRGVQIYPYTRDGGVWVYQRSGKHSIGSWEIPAGKCEYNESFRETAFREFKEETGLIISPGRFNYLFSHTVPSLNFIQDRKRWDTAVFGVVLNDDELPRIMEPDNHALLRKFDFSDIEQLKKTLVFDLSEVIRKVCTTHNVPLTSEYESK